MKTSLLEILMCPVCQKSLRLEEGTSSDDRLVKGLLRCLNGHLYQVKDEIPILKNPKLSKKEFVWKLEFPNIEKYDRIRKEYKSYLSEEQREADRALIDEIAKTVSKERVLLDVASGMGSLLLVLSQQLEKGKNVLGIDIDEKPLRGTKLKLKEQKSYSRVSLCVMDGKHLAVKPQKLPCVTSHFGLDNIPETKKAFQEVSRVLMPKGRLILATLWFKEDSRSLALAEKLGFGAITTENRLTRTLEETGFKIDSIEKFYSGKWPYNPMDRLPLEGDWYAHALVLAHKK
jgi:ubiquinone/menaquinone biosynthesis C-methylase UbiE/uncharacterized protein YbaR (Trm112 family)